MTYALSSVSIMAKVQNQEITNKNLLVTNFSLKYENDKKYYATTKHKTNSIRYKNYEIWS